MGHSITSYNDKVIVSKDFKIEVWLRLICYEVENIKNIPEWLKEAKAYWSLHVNDYINGCIDPRLEDFLTESERVIIFINICQRVLEKLSSFGDKIPKEYLNNLCNYQKPFEILEDNLTNLYLSYGKALIKLLKGEQEKQTENV